MRPSPCEGFARQKPYQGRLIQDAKWELLVDCLYLLPFSLDLPIKKITQDRLKEQNLTILINRGGRGREIRNQVPPLVGKNATKSLQGICSAKTGPEYLFSRVQKVVVRQLQLPFHN